MEKVIIVGGGITGLSCLNALLDKKIPAILLEKHVIGSPKICGEFIAPQTVEYLNKLQINGIRKIDNVTFFYAGKSKTIDLERNAGAIARNQLEKSLAERALRLGGNIQENTFLQNFKPGTASIPHTLHLNSGKVLVAENVIFSSGAFNNSNPHQKNKYYGIKFHFKKFLPANTLQMFSGKNVYLGIVPLHAEYNNCTCLVRITEIQKFSSAKNFFLDLIESQPQLKRIFSQINLEQVDWMEGPAPHFGIKNNPKWNNVFWIGDSLATLYPSIGSGCANSFESALNTVEYIAKSIPEISYAKKMKTKWILSYCMHKILIKPKLTQCAFAWTPKKIVQWILLKMDFTNKETQ